MFRSCTASVNLADVTRALRSPTTMHFECSIHRVFLGAPREPGA